MIELISVSKEYRLSGGLVVKAVDDVSLRISENKFVMIVGRSGSGKTTLLSLVGCLTKPTMGQVRIDGDDIWSLSDSDQSRLRAEKIGFVFQIPSLIPTLTVIDNVRLPTMFGRKEKANERVWRLIDQVGLSGKENAYPAQLSVGQQKRAVLARALINEPKILLADEPTSDLDKATEVEMMNLIKEIRSDEPHTVLLVTHNLDLAPYGDETYMMTDGRLSKVEGGWH